MEHQFAFAPCCAAIYGRSMFQTLVLAVCCTVFKILPSLGCSHSEFGYLVLLWGGQFEMQNYLPFRWRTLEIQRKKLKTFKMIYIFSLSGRERGDSGNEFVISLLARLLDVLLIFKTFFMVNSV